MKKNNIKTIIVAFCIFICLSANVFAELAWNNSLTMDFSDAPNGTSYADLITEQNSSFSAEVNGGALEIKSDAFAYFAVNNKTVVNDSVNSHKIKLLNTDRSVRLLDESIVFEGTQYDYIGKGNSSISIDTVADKNALKQFTYINEDKWGNSTAAGDVLRTNMARFTVDKTLFSNTDNKITVEIVYYTEDKTDNWCEIHYPKTESGADTIVNVYNSETLQDNMLGKWNKATILIENVDFTRNLAEGNNINFRVKSAPAKVNYFHSVSIYRTQDAASMDMTKKNIIQKSLAEESIFGNTKLSYKMTIPSGENLINDHKYNTGKNVMSVNLTDVNGVDVASILYEFLNDSVVISALSSDDSGTVSKNEIYNGSIKDEEYTYIILNDMRNRTYSVQIYDGENLVGETENSISILNKNVVAGFTKVKALTVKYDASSKAILSKIDDIKVDVQEDINYKKCIEDANAITLNVPEDNIVVDDFSLPTEGLNNGSVIEWVSSDSNSIRIENGGAYAKVIRDADDIPVTMTAEVTYQDYSVERVFNLVVKSYVGTFMAVQEPVIATNPDGTYKANIVVNNPGTAGATKIYFVVYSVNPATQDITDRKIDFEDVISPYGEIELGIDNLAVNSGNEIVYHLWDQNNVPIKNNAPTKIEQITVENKVKAIDISWDESYDDYNAVDYYEIYRNGSFLAKCYGTEYKDSDLNLIEDYTYTIVPVDTNLADGDGSNCVGKTIPMPFYLNTIGKTEVIVNSNGYGLNIVWRDDPERGAYTEHANVSGTECRYIPNGKYLGLYTDKSLIDEKEVAIDITYLDAEGDMYFQYNAVIPEGAAEGAQYAAKEVKICTMTNTGVWKVASVKLNDAQFRESELFSGADFGIRARNGNGLHIKKVEIVKAALYD